MLEVEALQSGYGPNPVLFGVDFAIREGEVVTLTTRDASGAPPVSPGETTVSVNLDVVFELGT